MCDHLDDSEMYKSSFQSCRDFEMLDPYDIQRNNKKVMFYIFILLCMLRFWLPLLQMQIIYMQREICTILLTL